MPSSTWLSASRAQAATRSPARAFEEMRDFGRRHGVLPMLARGIAMSAGIHIGLGDYARGEELAQEARELARRISFPPPFVSAGIDLLTVFARSHDPGRAEPSWTMSRKRSWRPAAGMAGSGASV